MIELAQRCADTLQPQMVGATERVNEANKRALDVMFAAQRLILEEMLFALDELLDRARIETHLFAELISKMAGVHSLENIRMMCEECGRHQIAFIRRDCERLFRHRQRMIGTTSELFRGSQS